MEKIVANGINYLKRVLTLVSTTIVLLPSTILAIDDETEVLFEDEPTTSVNSTSADAASSIDSTSDAASSVLFNFDLPGNTHLLMLFLAVILAIVLGIIFYRALLKSQVTKGVHPREFFATIAFMVLGFFLLGMFFILINSEVTSLGWFTILAGLYLFFLVVFMAMGRLRRWILVVLVLIVAVIGFQLTNMNIF